MNSLFLQFIFGQMSGFAALMTMLIAPAVRFAHQDTHQYEMFKANVKDLLGEHPAHDLLSGLCEEEAGGGKSVWIDGIDAEESEDADQYELKEKNTGVKFEQLPAGQKTFDNWQKTRTPFMEVSKQRTLSTPRIIEWGHRFDEDEGWQHLVDPKGKEVNVGVRKIFKGRDLQFLLGAAAPSVVRKGDADDDVHVISLPAGQALDPMAYADVNVDSLPSMICERFDNVWYAKGSPIYCAISATMARHFRQNSRSTINSTDFVSSYEHFKQGTLPQIDGITFIVLPISMMKAITGNGAKDSYVAWVPPAINKVVYSSNKTSMGEDPSGRFETIVYLREKIDFKRIDDRGVVVGDIV